MEDGAAAARAFESGPWPAMTATARGRLLRKMGDLIAKHAKHLAEIVYGRIYRAYLLPKDAKKEGIEARLAKGVLEVRIPREKRPEEPPVRIPIQES